MKKLAPFIYAFILLVIVVAAIVVAWKRERPVDPVYGITWKVDLDESLKKISKVPSTHEHKYKSLESYKNYVGKSAKDLTLTIHSNKKATIKGSWFSGNYRWYTPDDDYDYWIHRGGTFTAGMGHGFNRVSYGTAHLSYTIEFHEDYATRETLILKRVR